MVDFSYHQNLITICILCISLFLIYFLNIKKKDILVILMLYVWHTLFSFFYYYNSLINAADATEYYIKSMLLLPDFNVGTPFILWITAFFSKYLNFGYLNVTLVFNFFGVLGLILLFKSISVFNIKKNPWIFLLFLPSISFWSAGLGKDAVAFLAVNLFLYGIVRSHHLIIFVSLSILLMFMVRPHIALMFVVSSLLFYIIRARVHLFFKFMTFPFLLIAFMIVLQYVKQYTGLESLNLEDIDGYIENRQSYNLEGGSSIDISSMSYPMQVFTYIFRPLPFEAHSILAFLISLENVILLFLFLYISVKIKFNFKLFFKKRNLWLFLYIVFTCSLLSSTTANLGIATRQKWMFMPILIYLFMFCYVSFQTSRRIRT